MKADYFWMIVGALLMLSSVLCALRVDNGWSLLTDLMAFAVGTATMLVHFQRIRRHSF